MININVISCHVFLLMSAFVFFNSAAFIKPLVSDRRKYGASLCLVLDQEVAYLCELCQYSCAERAWAARYRHSYRRLTESSQSRKFSDHVTTVILSPASQRHKPLKGFGGTGMNKIIPGDSAIIVPPVMGWHCLVFLFELPKFRQIKLWSLWW